MIGVGRVDAIRKGFTGLGDDELVTAPTSPVRQSIIVHQSDIANNSGSASACGYGYKLLDANWAAGQWDNSEATEFTDDTTDAQDAGADDFALTTTTDDDGFAVGADEPFDLVGFTISTAEAGSPDYEYNYWNGSAWTDISTDLIVSPDFTSTGDTALVFAAPSDWAKGGDTGEGLDSDQYWLRVRATTAPDTAPLATKLWVVKLLDLVGQVSDGSTVNRIQYIQSAGNKVPPGHSLVPYCETSNPGNVAYFEYTFL